MDKKWRTFKQELKAVTRKTAPFSFDERIARLKLVYRGWINYFRMASMQAKLKELDGWLRNRLRYCISADWKKPERRRKNLIRLGVHNGQAYAWSRTRMGGWSVAQSPILVTTITLERLIKRGYESMLTYYEKVSPHLNEPLYTRPVAPMLKLRRKHTYSGHAFGLMKHVRGEPRQLQLARPSTRLCSYPCPHFMNHRTCQLWLARRMRGLQVHWCGPSITNTRLAVRCFCLLIRYRLVFIFRIDNKCFSYSYFRIDID